MIFSELSKISLWSKGAISVILLATLLAGLMVFPVKAYSGGYAVDFEGEGSVIKIDHEGVLGTREACYGLKSISLWVRPMGPSPSGPSAGDLDLIAADAPIWFGISRGIISNVGPDNGKDRIWAFNLNNNNMEDKIGVEYVVGEWVHITMVHAGGFLSIYKNGVLGGTIDSGPTYPVGCQLLSIGGKARGAPEQFFQGQIDDVAFWRAALDGPTIRRWMYREIDSSHPLYTSLGAYYSMLPGSGTTVSDDGPNDYYGTFLDYNPPGHSPVWLTSGAHAGPRYAYSFDGVDDYVSVPSTISMPAVLTLEASIYPRDLTGSTWIMGESGGARLVSNGTALEFYIHDGTALQGPATATLTPNSWQHIAGVFDGSTLQVYVNGVPGTDFSFNGSNQDMDGAFTLASPDGSSQFSNLLIDEVRLWNEARSAAQIRGSMYQTLQATETGLIAYYRMDTRGDGVMYDISSSNVDGILNGMQTGTATGGAATTITQSGAGWIADQFAGMVIEITGGSGVGQLREIVSNTIDTITISPDWITNPASGAGFRIYYSVSSTAFNTWIGSDSSDSSVAGNWSRNQAPVASDNVGIYGYPGGNNPSSSSELTVANMVVSANGVYVVTNSGNLTVDGRLFNYGSLQMTKPVSGTTDVDFFNTGLYGGLLINPNSDDLGDTTVIIQGNQDCTPSSGDTVQRCFDVTPSANAIGINKTVTFYFDSSEESGNTCTMLEAYHLDGSSWDVLSRDVGYGFSGRSCGADPRSIRVNNVNSFSAFALSGGEIPATIYLPTVFSAPALGTFTK